MWTRPLRVAPGLANEKPNQFQCIHDLSDATVRKLTRYLYLSKQYSTDYPPEDWLKDQEKGLRELPSDCLRPRVGNGNIVNFVKRGLMSISEKHPLSFTPQAAVLCSSHRGLNPWTIHALFSLVVKEITKETERLRRDRGGRNLQYSISVREFLHRLDTMQALWMDPLTFEMIYGRAPGTLAKVASQCEACILSAIGSRHVFLNDLRTHCIARTETVKPVLQKIVESWLAHFPSETQKSISRESSVLAEEIRTIRREIVVARHKRREAKRQRKERWTPGQSSKSSNSTSVHGPRRFPSGRQFTSSHWGLVSIEKNPFADVDNSNEPWQEEVGSLDDGLAVQDGYGHSIDRASVYRAFGNLDTQPDPLQSQAFGTGLEAGRSEENVMWEDAVSSSTTQAPTIRQHVMPLSSTRSGQHPFSNPLSTPVLQGDARLRNRFRNVSTSSVLSNNGPAQHILTHSEAPSAALPYTQHHKGAPSSVYTSTEPARPHPPRTDVSTSAAQSRPGPSGSTISDPERHLRPDAVVSNPSSRPRDDRPVIQDYSTTGLSQCPDPVSSEHPSWRPIEDERLRWKEPSEDPGRPSFTEHYRNKQRRDPMPPSGYRQHYGRKPSTPPPRWPSASSPQTRTPTVPFSTRNPTLDEVRRVAPVRAPVPPSDASTIWPHDSVTSVGMPR